MYSRRGLTDEKAMPTLQKKGLYKMTEDELKAKEEELKAKEEELKAKEATISEKDETLAEKEKDLNGLVSTMTKEYETKLEAQKQSYEGKLSEREKVIKELLRGDATDNNVPSEIDKLNEARKAQRLA